MKRLPKPLIVQHVEASRAIVATVAKTSSDTKQRKAARQLLAIIDEALDEGASVDHFKRITRATYRLIACIDGGLAA